MAARLRLHAQQLGEHAMAAADPYSATDKLDDAMLQVVVTRLETRGKHPRFVKILQEYLDAMGIDRAQAVLDIGCGTGVVSRGVARRPGFCGHVTGIDLSPALIATGAQLAADEGIGERITFCVGDTRGLDLADGAFDAVIAHTLLSHVADPLAVVKEIARVTRPGGMVGIFDADFASLTFGNADPVKGAAYDAAVTAAVATSPRVIRNLPRMLRAAGLELVAMFPHAVAEAGTADFWLPAIESFRRLVPKAGTMGEAETEAWAQGLRRDSDEGIFFGAGNYYSYVARKP
jgi:ubiquinone/menaquinone biosynthesis C-methylase UbiE